MPAVPLRTVAEDRCLIETIVTGAYINPCMIDSTRAFAWPSVGTVSIAQGSVGPGTTVLTAGTALASYLALDPDGSTAIRGKRVVELGCGTGLCGIVAARLGASQVLLTDGNSPTFSTARVPT
ncbi:hypothetical protein EMIHUDRAFT_241618 [Emiliania huxleyi CCMP1516]|uniref:Methyltransferase n=2 Tax=Emiliania huxleyi TaxID=2903 RepID=A0A0D3JCB0_EMIH1|nr:hypothetical protein EMIHUDRAFT_241618 [Emiliania huxleyi CCMP1516]EOD21145.1 hypothetical protein EMIHUDRAFT_241618 [Emiliania huxleyi CCMP1516]|eukprot:XP_005773574.1 hypothetical protein EMIHUDRAFT_241618 [Emiliania huxleyi CCMP1516]